MGEPSKPMILICDFQKEETYTYDEDIEDSLEVYLLTLSKQTKNWNTSLQFTKLEIQTLLEI